MKKKFFEKIKVFYTFLKKIRKTLPLSNTKMSCVCIKMSKTLSAKHYQSKKERLLKKSLRKISKSI